jgi:hypothetical protein
MSGITEILAEIYTDAFCQALEDIAAFHKSMPGKKYVGIDQVESYRDAVCTVIFDSDSREVMKYLTVNKEMFFGFVMSDDFTDIDQLEQFDIIFKRRSA